MHDTERERLANAFFAKYHIHAAGPEALDLILDGYLEKWYRLKDNGAMLRSSLERLFRAASQKLDSHSLEVSTPSTGEFLIGDAPAIAIDSIGRIGPHQGVGIESAATIALPLGPQLTISTGPDDCFHHLDQGQVDKLNGWQVRNASRFVYSRPDSHLTEFIRANRE
jgi:hypothetical protein